MRAPVAFERGRPTTRKRDDALKAFRESYTEAKTALLGLLKALGTNADETTAGRHVAVVARAAPPSSKAKRK